MTREKEENEAKRRTRPPINYPPYISGYGSISELFSKICQAAVPPKFTQDFMTSVLGMKSSSHRALIPLLKKLGFVDQANVPTEAYRQYRDSTKSQKVMAQQLRLAYSDMYQTHEYAHELGKEELVSKLRILTGAGDDDRNIRDVAPTFLELRKLADFSNGEVENQRLTPEPSQRIESEQHLEVKMPSHKVRQTNFGISYTINLNLPATTDVEVFNAIFKSLKENILYED
ncbi:DUF5343 domain-containing protein [Myxacorys almedinensis]|uniref:Uncharacterized protein n=1 Tax=Myxacorys almedinensis A TaxID=2690445 RepID=A0A8J7Z3J8_9CYAN|nr:hypothetical protein [Myxacorys almedinensis A]